MVIPTATSLPSLSLSIRKRSVLTNHSCNGLRRSSENKEKTKDTTKKGRQHFGDLF